MTDEHRKAAGGNAFPDQYHPGLTVRDYGLTVRDYFAAAALTGYIAAHAGDHVSLPGDDDAALTAYAIADAMLQARRMAPDATPPAKQD